MKKTYYILSFSFVLLTIFIEGFYHTVSAQGESQVYRMCEKPPKPVGGMSAFYDYTENHLVRPEEAERKGVSGNVFVQFVVEPDGKLSNIKVIKGIGAGCDEAVVKLLENAPKWAPGIQQGKPVRVRKTMSIQVR